MTQFSGTVIWFNNAKGYGFVRRPDGPDVFVHYSAIQGSGFKELHWGEAVQFDIVQGPNGRQQAGNVMRTLPAKHEDDEVRPS